MRNFPPIKKNINDLIPYSRNSRTHSDEQVLQIASSIKEFGFTNPVLIDPENGIIAGHGRVMAAKKLGLKDVPCIIAEGWTDAQKKAYIIADNKLALNAGWDNALLALEFAELEELGFDISLTGFSEAELAAINPIEVTGLTDEDAVPEAPEVPVTVLGDVWLLGNHRLMCGDSTSIDAVETLMAGQKADMLFTDPPYGDNHAMSEMVPVSERQKGKSIIASVRKIKNDDDIMWLSEAANAAQCVLNDDAARFVFFKWSKWEQIKGLFSSFGEPKMACVWDRDSQGASTFRINPVHEFCFYWGTLGDKKEVGNLRNVWRCKKERGASDMHPTVKPIEIIEPCIRMCASVRSLVLDLFGGSGSTLIACEKTGRHCRMMELDPKYIQVILQRWADFTGNEPVLESTGQTFSEVKNAR